MSPETLLLRNDPYKLIRVPCIGKRNNRTVHPLTHPCENTCMRKHTQRHSCESTLKHIHAKAHSNTSMRKHTQTHPCESTLKHIHAKAHSNTFMRKHTQTHPCESTLKHIHAKAHSNTFIRKHIDQNHGHISVRKHPKIAKCATSYLTSTAVMALSFDSNYCLNMARESTLTAEC
jgi:ketosteroid isomerase-like protein